MPQEPQYLLVDSVGDTIGAVYADSNDDLVLFHADSGNEVFLGSTGLNDGTDPFLTGLGIEDTGVAVSDADNINFDSELDITDDGDGSVTVAVADDITVNLLNGADIQNAASGEVPVAQGDGTLAMEDQSGGSVVTPLQIDWGFLPLTTITSGGTEQVYTTTDAGRPLSWATGYDPGGSMEHRLYYDGEASPSFTLQKGWIDAVQGIYPTFSSRRFADEDAEWPSHYIMPDTPEVPSVDAEVYMDPDRGDQQAATVFMYGKTIDMEWTGGETHADSGWDEFQVSSGSSQQLASDSTAGRLRGVFIESNGESNYNIDITLDGVTKTLEWSDVDDVAGGLPDANDTQADDWWTYSSYPHIGGFKHTGVTNYSLYYTPQELGTFDYFDTSMSITINNNGGETANVDHTVVWDRMV